MNTENGALNFTADINDEKLLSSIDEMEKRIKGFSSTTVKESAKIDQLAAVTAENVQIQKQVIADLEKQLTIINKKIDGMAPGAAQEQLKKEAKAIARELAAEKNAMVELEKQFKKTEEKTVSFRTQLRNAREELIRMEQAGLRGTEAYQKLQAELGQLTDAYDDAAQQARVMADDEGKFKAVVSTIGGISGAFSAAQGAVGLFSGESENLQKVMLRVQSLMGVTIGLQQVAEMLNKDSYFSIMVLTKAKEMLAIAETKVATAMGVTTAAARVLIGTLTLGLSVAITAVIVLLNKYITKQQEAKKRQEEFNKAVTEAAYEPIAAIQSLVSEWSVLATTMKEKEDFVKNNEKRFKALGLEVNNVAEAEALLTDPENIKKFISAQIFKAKAMAASQIAAEKYREALEKQLEAEKMPDTVARPGYGSKYSTASDFEQDNPRKANAEAASKALEEEGQEMIAQATEFSREAEQILKDFQFTLKDNDDDASKEALARLKEYNEMRESLIKKSIDNEVELERSKIKDKKELIDFDLEQTLKAIDTEQAEYEKKAKDAGQKNPDLGVFDKLRQTAREQATQDKFLIDQEALAEAKKKQDEAEKKRLEDEKKALEQLLENYKTEKGKFLAAEEKFNTDSLKLSQALAEAKTDQEASQIKDAMEARRKAYSEETSELGLSKLMSSSDWTTLFGDLETLTIEKMIELRDKLEAEWSKLNLSPEQLKAIRDQMNQVTEHIQNKNPFKALTEALKAYKKEQSTLNLKNLTGAVVASANYINDNLQSVFSSLDNLGVKGMEEASKIASDITGIVGEAGNLAMGIATGNPLQIVQASIGLITKGIDMISGIKDRKLERSIENHRKEVERLQLAYEDLERAIDKALGSDRYVSQKQQIDNLKKQRQEYALMIQAENNKKKTDDGKIDEYQRNMRDNAAAIVSIVEGIREEILGGTISSVANDLGNAIIDAFSAGEDAAVAWGKKVDEIVGNVIRKMLIQKLVEEPVGRVINQYMSKWVDSNGNFIGFDAVMTTAQQMGNDLSALGTGLSSALSQLPDEIKKYFTGGDAEKGALSGAIQGASEESISLLSGYINAVRINQIESQQIMRSQLMALNQISSNTSYNVLLVDILSAVRTMANSDTLRPQGL